jgi:hypothetical protein
VITHLFPSRFAVTDSCAAAALLEFVSALVAD